MSVCFSIPMELKNGRLEYSECTMYKLNYSDIAKNYRGIESGLKSLKGSSAEIIPCTNGWVYEKSVYKSTVVSEVYSFIIGMSSLPVHLHTY